MGACSPGVEKTRQRCLKAEAAGPPVFFKNAQLLNPRFCVVVGGYWAVAGSLRYVARASSHRPIKIEARQCDLVPKLLQSKSIKLYVHLSGFGSLGVIGKAERSGRSVLMSHFQLAQK